MSDLNNLGDVVMAFSEDPQRTAVIDLRDADRPVEYSYRDLALLSGGVADYLISLGLERGARVGVLSLNRTESLAAYFGIMRAGMVAVPVNIKLPPETLAFIVADADLRLIFVDGARRALVPGAEVVDFDDNGPDGFHAVVRPTRFDSVVPEPIEDAEMLYTSGSSGVPKGVPLTHSGQLWALRTLSFEQQAEPQRQIIAQPLFHMNGIVVSSLAFLGGDTVVLQPGFRADAYVEAIARYSVTTISAVPTMWARALNEVEAGRGDISSVQVLSLGSAPTTTELIARTRALRPGITIALSYGTTEAGPSVFGPHPDGLTPPALSLGYPLPGVELRLIDGPSPDEGALVMRTPAVMRGYHKLPERSETVLDDGWYYSGDMMRRDDDGFYFFIGRADDMFVCSGENIYPGEVEKLLERHPLIRQAVVLPMPDTERGQMPAAFIVPKPGTSLTAKDVTSFALANGAPHLHPRRIAIVTDLPMAGTNKTDRAELQRTAYELEQTGGWSS